MINGLELFQKNVNIVTTSAHFMLNYVQRYVVQFELRITIITNVKINLPQKLLPQNSEKNMNLLKKTFAKSNTLIGYKKRSMQTKNMKNSQIVKNGSVYLQTHIFEILGQM